MGSRYETEGLGRVDELETARNKLQARIQEAEENVESLNVKIANGEKSRSRMQADLEELIPLLSLLRSVARTLIRSLVNGRPRLMTLQLRLRLAKRNVATTTVNFTGSRLPMMKLLSNLML